MNHIEKKNTEKPLTAFYKKNYIIMAIGYALVVIGFLLMMGPESTDTYFEPDIFSVQRIVVAPFMSLTGFIVILIGIIYRIKV